MEISRAYATLERDGSQIKAPPGWRLLAEGEGIPSEHREYIESYSGGWHGWAQPRRCRSTMTAIVAQIWGGVRAYAVPAPAEAPAKPQPCMVTAEYIGKPIGWNVRPGMRALIRPSDKSGVVLAQFNDFHARRAGKDLAFGWHEFPETDWKVEHADD